MTNDFFYFKYTEYYNNQNKIMTLGNENYMRKYENNNIFDLAYNFRALYLKKVVRSK